MAEYRERREVPRAQFVASPAIRVSEVREVRLIDLSPAGARIEHLGLLRPGTACSLELPADFGSVVLPARVVWCTVIGTERLAGGERYLRSQSGVRFGALTESQHLMVAEALNRLTSASLPPA